MKYVASISIGMLSVFLTVSLVFARTANDPQVQNWALTQIGAPHAWDVSTGSRDVVVAVIDNGFDYLHPELFPNTWKNIDELPNNGIDDDNNGYIDDVWGWDFSIVDRNNDGDIDDEIDRRGDNNPRPDVAEQSTENSVPQVIHHGTIVAGIIGAKGNNGIDGTGLNWDIQLMNIRLVGNSGFAEQTSIAESIYYAVDNGADIINFSLVTQDLDPRAFSALKYAYQKGVVVVSAAGNDQVDLEDVPYYPICADEEVGTQEVLGVSAIREGRAFADFSNYGSNCIDITAPGAGLKGVLVYAPEVGLHETYGGNWQGTSFAAPYVSGAAALIKSVQPHWGPNEIFATLQSTTSKTQTDDEEGYKDLFGSGLLQIDKALQKAIETKQKPSELQALKTIQTISLSQGSSRLKNIAQLGLTQIMDAEQVRGVDDIARTTYAGEYVYATAQYKKDQQVVLVQILDKNFKLIDSFEKKATEKHVIAVADFAPGFEGIEVVLAPYQKNHNIYELYSQKGTLLESESLKEEHLGARVSVSYHNFDHIPQIVVAYRVKKGLSVVKQYDLYSELHQEFLVESVEGIGEIIAADINGDGKDEYVVGSLADEPARLVYYSAQGTQLRKFLPYNGGERVAMHFDAADFDNDGKEDILVAAEQSLHPVRIWTDKSKKLLTWYPVHNFLFPVKRFFFNE